MKASLLNKLDNLSDRFEELTALLGDAEVISKQTQFRAYSREYAEIEPVIATFRELRKVQSDLEGAQALLKESDPDLREMAEEEVAQATVARGLKLVCIDPRRIGCELTENWQIDPEQSTSAIIVHHPEAKYFNV